MKPRIALPPPESFSGLEIDSAALQLTGDVSITAESDATGTVSAAEVKNNGSLKIENSSSVILTSYSTKSDQESVTPHAQGLILQDGAQVAISTDRFEVTAKADHGSAHAIQSVESTESDGARSSILTVTAKTISIEASGAGFGIESNWGSEIKLTAEESLSVLATSNTGQATGVLIDGWLNDNESKLTLDGKTITVTAQQTTEETTSKEIYGINSRANGADVHSAEIGSTKAKEITVSASSEGNVSRVIGVNVAGGSVELGNKDAVVQISASAPNGKFADGIQVTGESAELVVNAKELNIDASAKQKAVGIRIADNGTLTVNAVTDINVTGGTDVSRSAEGIRLNSYNDGTNIGFAGSAVFNGAVTVIADGKDQTARGASVMVSSRTSSADSDLDKGGKLTFNDGLTLNVTGGINASGVEIDNNFLNGDRDYTYIKGSTGVGAEIEVAKLLKADVTAAQDAYGAKVMNSGVLTAKGGVNAKAEGDSAYGIGLLEGSRTDIQGAVSLEATGKTKSYGLYLGNGSAANIEATTFEIASTATDGSAYGIKSLSQSGGTNKLTVSADSISIAAAGTSAEAASGSTVRGIESNWGSQFTLVADSTLSVNASSSAGSVAAVLVDGWNGTEDAETGEATYTGSSLSLNAQAISITAKQTASEETSDAVYGLHSRGNSKDIHNAVIGESAKNISITAESQSGASSVEAVRVVGGSVTIGNEDAVIEIRAVNPTQTARAVWVAGEDASLTITGKKLNIYAENGVTNASGIRVLNNGSLTVDAVTDIIVKGSGTSTDYAADGIRVSNMLSSQTVDSGETVSTVNTVYPAAQNVVFKQAVSIDVQTQPKQSARGASVLVAASTEPADDKGVGELTFENDLTVKVQSGRNGYAVEVDKAYLDGSRSGVGFTGEPGESAEIIVGGLLSADVKAENIAMGAKVKSGGVLTAKGGVDAKAEGEYAYGIGLFDGSGTDIKGAVSLEATGQTESYGLYLGNGSSADIAATKFEITSTASDGSAYGIKSLSQSGGINKLTVSADSISIAVAGTSAEAASGSTVRGIESNWGSQFTLSAKDSLTVTAQTVSSSASGLLINGYEGTADSDSNVNYTGSTLGLDAKNIEIAVNQTGTSETAQNAMLYGINAKANGLDVHSANIGTEAAEKITVSASSEAGVDSVRGVSVAGGTVKIGNANAVIDVSAANPTEYADAVWVSGKNAVLAITGKELNVSASADMKATGIRISDSGSLTVDALTNVTVNGGGTDNLHAADGIRVSNYVSGTKNSETGEITYTILPATQKAEFNKAVTVNVTTKEGQSARGASVLVGAATDSDGDKGGLLTFKDALTANVTGGKNASGVEVDNNFLDGTRSGTDVTSGPGAGAAMVIEGLLTADVSAAERGVGARIMKGGELTATGGMTATVAGDTAYGISVTDGSEAHISGPLSLKVSGQTAGYGVYMTDSTAEIGEDGKTLDISVSGGEAYIFHLTNSDLTVKGDLNVQSGKIKLADSALLLNGAVEIAGGLDSVEGGLMTIAGSYSTVSSDIFNAAAGETATDAGGIKDGVSDKIAFAEGSRLVLNDEYYTLKYLTSAESNFSENAPSITMTGTLAGELGSDGLKDLPEDTVLVKVEVKSQGDLTLGDDKISGSSVGVGSISLDGGNKLTFSSESNKTLSVIGSGGSLITGDGPITISIEKSGTLAIGGDYTQGGSIDGEISASGSARITISGDKGTVKEFSVSGNLTLSENASLEIGSASKLAVSELHVDADSTVTVGSSDAYGVGKLIAKVLNLKGKAFFDPVWTDGEEKPSQVAVESLAIADGGQITVGRNSTFTVGSADETAALGAVKAAGYSLAESSITAAMLVNGTVSVGKGAINVDGSVTEAPTVDLTAGSVTIADNALLAIGATNDTASGSAVVFEGATLNLAPKSVLYVDLSEVTTTEDLQMKLADTVNSEIAAENILGSSALWYNYAITDGILTASYDPTSKLVENGLIAPNTIRESIMTGSADAAALNELIAAGNFSGAAGYANKKALMATASAAQILAVNTGNMIADTIEEHGSALAGYAHKAGADLWIDINGSFSKATSYKAGTAKYGYKADLAGVTIGADYALGNGAALGGAFSFGTGSARGQGAGAGTKNDVDYYGLNLYGVLATDYVNVIGSIGYSIGKNEIKQSGVTGKPDVKTFSLALRAEKSLAIADGFDVTPHIGIRYMNIDMDSFTAGGYHYSAKKANLAQVPFGAAFSGSFKAPCGASVKPFIDVTVAPAFGDKKVTNRFALAGGASSDSIDARIANSSMYQGRIGLNAVKGSHSLGINYSVGGGNNGRVDQSLQARYRYSF